MSRFDASYEIHSKADAFAVRRLLEQVHDLVREGTMRCEGQRESPEETLRAFEAVCDAARDPSPGVLTVVYERGEETFEG